jgi:hypothetical protein
MNNRFSRFNRSLTDEQHFTAFQKCSTALDQYYEQNRKTVRCYANLEIGVTQRHSNDYAVHAVQARLAGLPVEIGNPLRQKPTNIEWGVPVGTKRLDRVTAQRGFCRRSMAVRAMSDGEL